MSDKGGAGEVKGAVPSSIMEGGKRGVEGEATAADRETRKKAKVGVICLKLDADLFFSRRHQVDYNEEKVGKAKKEEGSEDEVQEVREGAGGREDLLGLPVEPTGLEGSAFQSRVPHDKMTQVCTCTCTRTCTCTCTRWRRRVSQTW